LPLKLSKHRFKKNEISTFLANSHNVKAGLFTLFYETSAGPRYAVVCPKKVGSSPVRNKVKRQLREMVQATTPMMNPNVSLIIIAHKKILSSTFKNTRDVLLWNLKKRQMIQC
jgi:ribonuclease P protein component